MTIDNQIIQTEKVRLAAAAISEDLGAGDITANLIEPTAQSQATIICRQAAVIAGTDWCAEVFRQIDPDINLQWHVEDGQNIAADTCLCELSGTARSLLSGERAALNILQTLSATATLTHQYVNAVAHTNCQILDTRKTIPGLRIAQKYAVSCGGGTNHRIGLYDMILIKENHIIAAGSIANAINQAKALNANVKIEVEVETLDELKQAIDTGADIVLLDNMNEAMLREAVTLNQQRVKLEASGGISIENIGKIAETGVDYISVGLITKNIDAIDLSMRFEN